MLIAEIKWLTSSLSDNAKFLAKRKQPQDLLAQSEYRMLDPTPEGLTQFAPAPLETVFYDVDVPLLKMVISEYNSAYNKTIIARAFNVQVERDSGFAKKEDIIKILKQAKDFHTKDQEDISKRIKELGLEESLINLKGLTPGMLVTLGEKKILTLEDFADLASDELTGSYDVIRGSKVKIEGYLEDFALSKEEADSLIMSAREIAYKD